MKKTFAIIYAVVALAGQATAVENQTQKAKKMGDGLYTDYVITYDLSTQTYSYAGCCGTFYEMKFSPFGNEGLLQFDFKVKESTLQPVMYIPDQDAFPATYVKGRYMGSADMINKYHAIERTETERIVFMDKWVYVLSKFQNKDSYVIEKVMVFGEIKSVKEAFAAKKKMENAKHKEVLQAYLDSAFAKQAELLPAWTASHQDLIKEREEAIFKVREEIKGVNAAYWNSPEGQRKLAEMRQPDVVLVNDTGSDLLLCYGSGAYWRLKPGEKKSFTCVGGKVYRGTPRPNNQTQFDATKNVLLDLDGKNCGRVVNASTVIQY